MDPKHISPNPDQPGDLPWPAQAEAATPDDIEDQFQRFCHLHGITPELAVTLANIWLRQEQITLLQARLAGLPWSNGGSAPVSNGTCPQNNAPTHPCR